MKALLRYVGFGLLVSLSTQAQPLRSYAGEATSITFDIFGIPFRLGSTGALPAQGGSRAASSIDINIPLNNGEVLEVDLLSASTVGQGNSTQSQASIANLGLTVGGISIGASVLQATATAQCGNQPSGSSGIIGLLIDNAPIVVTGQPNQSIDVGPVTIIINEQIVNNGTMRVNALHIKPTSSEIADIILASATAGITCSGN